MSWRAGGFGLYIHWPFCLSKCPYCDFNSHVVATVDQPRWRAALLREMATFHDWSAGRRLDTVFFGGGTPSLMPPETVAALIEAADQLWGLAPGVEITLEANPTSVEAERFRAYAAAGVNRISMGVQALNDADLKALGRTHGAAEARAAFAIARAAFQRVSFDLIYARVGQSAAAWALELAEAIDMAVDHLSLYQLTIEPGTRFAELHARGKLVPPDGESAADMYAATQEVCAAKGLPAYEISNHARPGAESRHNLVYWRMGDYAGIGPGAHSRLTDAQARRALETLRAPGAWLEAVEATGAGVAETAALDREAQALELLIMGLRLAEGVDLARLRRLSPEAAPRPTLDALTAEGLIRLEAGRAIATARGRPLLDAVLRRLTG